MLTVNRNPVFDSHYASIQRMAGLREEDILNVYPYGSRVYGTYRDRSDYDYIIVAESANDTQQFDSHDGSISCHVYTPDHWQHLLNEHKIFALECQFLPSMDVYVNKRKYDFKLDRPTLRKEISSKSSNSWVKCKKKLEIEKELNIGLKSLFHSLRIPIFGKQIAKEGTIYDYTAANHFWERIETWALGGVVEWEFYKNVYQPIHNELLSDFRKYAEKE